MRAERGRRIFRCEICGCQMVERQCKVSCPNCGNRFDCSDLTLDFGAEPGDEQPRSGSEHSSKRREA